MGFGKLFGFGGRNGNGSRDSRESRGSGSRGARDTQSAGADYDRELTETFGFVGEGEERDEGKEAEPVFEEVAEEDRTEQLVRDVLSAEAKVNAAASLRRSGIEYGFDLELARRGLAQVHVEQARYNLDRGKGTQEQLDQAIRELERAEETLKRSEEGAEALARHRAERAAGGEIDIGAYTAGQIRGRPRRERTGTSSSA